MRPEQISAITTIILVIVFLAGYFVGRISLLNKLKLKIHHLEELIRAKDQTISIQEMTRRIKDKNKKPVIIPTNTPMPGR